MNYPFKIKILRAIDRPEKIKSVLFAYDLIDGNTVSMRKAMRLLGFSDENNLSRIRSYANGDFTVSRADNGFFS